MSERFNIKDFRAIAEMLEKHGVTEFKYEQGDERLTFKCGSEVLREQSFQSIAQPPIQQIFGSLAGFSQPMTMPSAETQQAATASSMEKIAEAAEIASANAAESADRAPASKAFKEIISPMVGTFYRRPAVDAEPYVGVGDSVKKGDVLCIVEAMKLMNEIESDVSGVVKEICLEDAQMVEYGEVLFRIEER